MIFFVYGWRHSGDCGTIDEKCKDALQKRVNQEAPGRNSGGVFAAVK